MKSLIAAAVATLAFTAPLQAFEIGVRDFVDNMVAAVEEHPTELRLSNFDCVESPISECSFRYGDLEIVASANEGEGNLDHVTFTKGFETSIYQIFEGIEISLSLLRPEWTELERRRAMMEIIENLLVTAGRDFSTTVKDLNVATAITPDAEVFVYVGDGSL